MIGATGGNVGGREVAVWVPSETSLWRLLQADLKEIGIKWRVYDNGSTQNAWGSAVGPRLLLINSAREAGCASALRGRSAIAYAVAAPELFRAMGALPQIDFVFVGEVERLHGLIKEWESWVRWPIGRTDSAALTSAFRVLAEHPSQIADRPRSISAVADRVGCSRGYLAQTARAHGIDLRRLIDIQLTGCALWLRNERTVSWEVIAYRLGYRSPGGLTELFRRTIGVVPSSSGPKGTELLEAVRADALAPARRAAGMAALRWKSG